MHQNLMLDPLRMLPTEIWIADDDSDDQYIYKQALAEINTPLPVKFFNNGYSLLNELINRTDDFCYYLIVDSRMPILDGLGVIRELSERGLLQNNRVVFLSTRHSPLQESYVRNLGVDCYEKPVLYDDLVAMFKDILKRDARE